MKRLFRILAIVVLAVTAAIWAGRGANTGWTKNRIQEVHTDEITGIEHAVWRDTWLPGADFAAVGLACAGALLIASMMLGRKRS